MAKPVAFITGIAGFAGSHLAEELLGHGFKVAGTLLKGESTENIATVMNELDLVEMDILDRNRCEKTVGLIKPHYLFHLAAFSSVGRSFANERLVYKINFEGTLNILEASLPIKKLKKLVFVSSSDCYGRFSPRGRTLTEDQPFNPVSPYGISKAAAEFACRSYYIQRELPVTIARSFNHSGPRQDPSFVIPSFARQIAAIERSGRPGAIRVGNLTAKRDISDVRDIVHGYRLLALKGKPGQAYHLCAGRTVSIKTILDRMLKISEGQIRIKTDRSLMRPNDIPILKGDNSRARNALGFRISYDLNMTIKETLNYFREKSDS